MNKHNYDCDRALASEELTNKQRLVFETLKEVGTVKATSDVLGIAKRNIQRMLSSGYKKVLAEEVDDYVPYKQSLAGTSTLYKTNEETGEKEEILQWVKTSKDQEAILEAMQEATQELAKSVEGKACKIRKPKDTNDNLLVVYVNTDLHLGQYAWGQESSKDVNIDIVYNNTLNSMGLLSNTTPNSKECIVLDLGDTLHAANDDARTKSGHVLDTDSRHAKVFKTLVDMKIKMIELALKKHSKVKYTIVAGNHSDLVANYIMAMLAAWFKNEPRFEVDESVALHKYHKHGEVLLGFHHGHATPMKRLPEVMVWDKKDCISHTTYRYWLTGHVHKDTLLDSPIARCESFRNNTSNDAWAQGAGFRGHKQSVAVTYHKDYGEIARNICPIKLTEEM